MKANRTGNVKEGLVNVRKMCMPGNRRVINGKEDSRENTVL